MWNYRIIRHQEEEADYFAIHEVLYGDDGKPNGVTENPIDVLANTPLEVVEVLLMMVNDAQRSMHDVLDYADFEDGGKYGAIPESDYAKYPVAKDPAP